MNVKSRITTGSAAVLLGAGLLLAGCGSDDNASDDTTTTVAEATTTTTEAATTTAPAGELTIDGAWARTSPSATTKGAIYLQINNGTDTDDALLDASVDAAVAGKVEIHETKMAGGDTTGGGMMEMAEVDEIPVPAGETVSLEPGGFHIMLMDLVAPLEKESTIEVTLTFENAGEVVVEAEVRDTAP
jgi:copper(I)-binding protein